MPLSDDFIKGIFALVGGVIGATIGAIIKGYFDNRTRERREIIVSLTRPSSLILMSRQIESRVEVKVDGQIVRSLSSCEVGIANAGNKAIIDVCVRVEIEGDAELISAQPTQTTRKINDLELELQAKRINIRMPYLNPSEEVSLVLFATDQDFTTNAFFRQKDVSFRLQNAFPRELLNPMSIFLIEVIRSNPVMDLYFRFVSTSYKEYVEKMKSNENMIPELSSLSNVRLNLDATQNSDDAA